MPSGRRPPTCAASYPTSTASETVRSSSQGHSPLIRELWDTHEAAWGNVVVYQLHGHPGKVLGRVLRRDRVWRRAELDGRRPSRPRRLRAFGPRTTSRLTCTSSLTHRCSLEGSSMSRVISGVATESGSLNSSETIARMSCKLRSDRGSSTRAMAIAFRQPRRDRRRCSGHQRSSPEQLGR